VVRRTLSDEQLERRDRVVQVATELADAGGYDAVVMKEVAERSEVSLATLYRWFASKDQLLTEVLLAWGESLSDVLAEGIVAGPRVSDVAARLGAMFGRVMNIAASRPRLAEAIVTAVLAVEPAVIDAQADFHRMVVAWIDAAMGPDEIPDRDDVVNVLELVAFAMIIQMVSGSETAESAADRIETAARLLIRS
jgi:AcrR family transcriptional regulator